MRSGSLEQQEAASHETKGPATSPQFARNFEVLYIIVYSAQRVSRAVRNALLFF